MKLALPVWNGRLAPVFDVAGQVLLVTVDGDQIVGEQTVAMPHELPLARVHYLADQGVSVLICGAISRPLFALGRAYGIHIYPFTAGPTHEVLQAWIEDRLGDPVYAMPGCGQGRGACRGRGRGLRRRQGITKQEDL